jgi:hypothetical protein
MANIFAITTLTEEIKADNSGKASAVFTVTNTSNKPVRGVAKAKALGNTQQDWIDLEGEMERDFSASGTQQFTINFHKPAAPADPGAPAPPPEKFPFRLDVALAANTDEQFTEGPAVKVEVTSAPVEKKKPFPWWILAIIGAVLLIIIIVVVIFMMRGGKTNPPPPPTPTPTVTPTVPPGTIVEIYNLYDHAREAAWRNDQENLPFNGRDGDQRGFVIDRKSVEMETSRIEDRVLETHPRWSDAPGGPIQGTFTLPQPIQAGDRFRARVGFMKNGRGNLTMRVLFNGDVIGEIPKRYDEAIRDWKIDLSDYAGQSGIITLQILPIPTHGAGWICWINPRIERVTK